MFLHFLCAFCCIFCAFSRVNFQNKCFNCAKKSTSWKVFRLLYECPLKRLLLKIIFFLQILIDLIIHGRGSARESALAKKFKYCYFREEENTVEN